jgi:hypothetical protein
MNNNINVITSDINTDDIIKDILENDIKILANTDNSSIEEFISILIDLNMNRNGLTNFIKYINTYQNKYIKIFVAKNKEISLLIAPILLNDNTSQSLINVISKYMVQNKCYKSNSDLINNFINNNNINFVNYFV